MFRNTKLGILMRKVGGFMVLIGEVWIIFVSLQSENQQKDEQIHKGYNSHNANDYGSFCCWMQERQC